MLALHPRVTAAVWAAVEGLLPPRPADTHPLGCHRPRIADRACFTGILYRLVLGCSWVTAGRLVGVSASTLRRRRDAWVAAGVFDALCDEALAGYDRIRGLDLSEVSIDGSLHKAPCGGQGSGPNPTDRGKLGWKWSLATDRNGVPIGWAIDGANRHDIRLLEPTLDAIEGGAGLLAEIDTLHLDRGYDADTVRTACAGRGLHDVVIANKRKRGHAKRQGAADPTHDDRDRSNNSGAGDNHRNHSGAGNSHTTSNNTSQNTSGDSHSHSDSHSSSDGKARPIRRVIAPHRGSDGDSHSHGDSTSTTKSKSKGGGDKQSLGLGLRWAVERTNSWFSNFGQLRRNTDRRVIHRLAQIALAVTLILTVKLLKWADRWNRAP
jgi:transposase